jgi:hypothetical protein
LATGVPTTWADGKPADEDVIFTSPGMSEGLHRVAVKAGGFSAVTDMVLVAGEQ